MDAILERFGGVHKSLHGDGKDILGRILLTCEQMLHDRGCKTVETVGTLAEILESATQLALVGHGEGLSSSVYIHAEEKVGVKFARTVMDAMEEQGRTHAIIVSVDGPTPFTKKECDQKPVQFLLARDVCVNVSRHHLVPKHEVMESPPPGFKSGNLPKIFDTDPVAQYYNWPIGTVVRVWRTFGGSEPIPYFRVVCPGNN